MSSIRSLPRLFTAVNSCPMRKFVKSLVPFFVILGRRTVTLAISLWRRFASRSLLIVSTSGNSGIEDL